MLYLIDGHNLIPFIKGLNLKQLDDEIQLLNKLQDFARENRAQIEVFFDGAPPGWSGQRKYGGITAHYVARGKTADEAIRQRLDRLPAGSGVAVVSSDRQVQAEARNHRAEIIPSGVFAEKIPVREPKARPRKPKDAIELDADEVDEWLRLFGEEDEK